LEATKSNRLRFLNALTRGTSGSRKSRKGFRKVRKGSRKTTRCFRKRTGCSRKARKGFRKTPLAPAKPAKASARYRWRPQSIEKLPQSPQTPMQDCDLKMLQVQSCMLQEMSPYYRVVAGNMEE